MTEMNAELLVRLVVGRKRDGRCRYDPLAKQALRRGKDRHELDWVETAQGSIGLHSAVSAGFCVQRRLDLGAGLEARNAFPACPDLADASSDAAT